MNLFIQDPSCEGYSNLHEVLLEECKGSTVGGGAYAFAHETGIKMLLEDEKFKDFLENGTYYLIVGTDDITNTNSLKALKSLCNEHKDHLIVKAYVHDSQGSTFHPKFSWFKKENSGTLIIGSGNLTKQGLRNNREAFSVINCTLEEISEVENSWNDWIKNSDSFLFDVESEEALEKVKLNEKENNLIRQTKFLSSKNKKNKSSLLDKLFKNQPKSKLWSLPKAKKRNNSSKGNSKSVDLSKNTNNIGIKVLIAEIPKNGDRTKQVNVGKESFINFFGIKVENKNQTQKESNIHVESPEKQHVYFKRVTNDGLLGKIQERPAVVTDSKNWRFELEGASNLDYDFCDESGKRNWPIGIFIKLSPVDFLYELINPDNINYPLIEKLLDEKKISPTNCRRIEYSCSEVKERLPRLGIWTQLKSNE